VAWYITGQNTPRLTEDERNWVPIFRMHGCGCTGKESGKGLHPVHVAMKMASKITRNTKLTYLWTLASAAYINPRLRATKKLIDHKYVLGTNLPTTGGYARQVESKRF
jgi:hypothetical protein